MSADTCSLSDDFDTSSITMMSLKLSLLTLLIVAPGLLVSAENVVTCAGYVQRLTCESGVINIQASLYGRKTQSLCNVMNNNAAELANTNCSSTVTSTIIARCNGQKECEFKTDAIGLADPCPGTYKYLNTTFSCVTGRSRVICDDSYNDLYCANETITIINAVYGRTDTTTCTSGISSALTSNINCNFNARDKVSTLCNKKTKCTLYASSGNFTDVCPGTKKYLAVTYACVQIPKTVVACDNTNATLTCVGKVIKVTKATYGRTDSKTCSAGLPPCQVFITNCSANNTLASVANSCNGRNSCVVPAKSQTFGDPCLGTHKYLTIEYTCV